MDQRTRNQSEGGLVKITGATTPTGFPHLCPYQQHGAKVEVCKDFTSNYQRNLAGCCGTQDNRAFAPCNSQFRKCRRCLSEGKGSRAGVVVDVQRGLCENCVEASGNPPKIVVPARPVLHVPPKQPEASKPAWKPTPKPVVAAPTPSPKPKPIPALKIERVTLPALPGAEELEARVVNTKKPTAPKAPIAHETQSNLKFDLDVCVAKYLALTDCNKESVGYLVRGKVPPSWSTTSVKTKRSELCSMVGIPKANDGPRFNRVELLKQVVAKAVESGSVSAGTLPDDPTPPDPPAPDSNPVQEPKYDPDLCAQRALRLTARERQILEDLAVGRRPDRLTESSVSAYLSSIGSKLGLPKAHRLRTFDRRAAVMRVWARSKELHLAAIHGQKLEEELLDLFRRLPKDDMDKVLDYLRVFSKGNGASE